MGVCKQNNDDCILQTRQSLSLLEVVLWRACCNDIVDLSALLDAVGENKDKKEM